MIRCRNVAELLTSDRLRDAGAWTRFQAALHLWMCRHCARLAAQLKHLRAAAGRLAATIDQEKTGTAAEDRLEARLLRKLSGSRH
jgi:hypothetical protein